VASLAQQGLDEAAAWREFLTAADLNCLRTSPAPGLWSPAQYAAHVRDMLGVFGDRILLAVAEDNPAVPWFEPGEDEWRHFNELPPSDLATGIDHQARRLAGILDDRQADDWSRTAVRDGVDRFTVAGLACFVVHEAHHHLLDAKGQIPAAP